MPPSTLPPLPPLDATERAVDYSVLRSSFGRWELGEFDGRTYFADDLALVIAFPGDNRIPASAASFKFLAGECGHRGTISAVGGEARFYRYNPPINFIVPAEEEPDCSPDASLFAAFLSRVVEFSVEGNTLELVGAEGATARFNRVSDDRVVVGTEDDVEVVAARVHFIDGTGFVLGVQEQKGANGVHSEEVVGWAAWSRGRDAGRDTVHWEAGRVALRKSAGDPSLDRGTSLGFEQGYHRPCFLANILSHNGSDPVSLRYRYLTVDGVHVHLTEDTSATENTEHTGEVAGYLAANCGGGNGFIIDQIDGLTADWRTVSLPVGFADPVVVAGPPSRNGADPGVIEIRNVASRSFQIRYREWDYLDRRHPTAEGASYLVVERGVTILPSGARIEAGSNNASDAFSVVEFAGGFDGPPVVLTTVYR